jgi:hypothetical protein
MRSIFYVFSLVANIFMLGNSTEVNVGPSYATHLTNLDLEESCNLLKLQEDCNANSECSWCVSGAVKSSCHSLENASRLPPSIFICNGLKNEDVSIESMDFYDDLFGSNDVTIEYKPVEQNLGLEWHPRWVDFLHFIETFNKKYLDSELEQRFTKN